MFQNINIDIAQNILRKHYQKQYTAYADDENKNWCDIKYKHSLYVFKIMQDLLAHEKELTFSKETSEKLLCASVLHDIGRFYQMKNGILNKNINHGELGKQILSNEINDSFILLLISHHEDLTPDLLLSESVKQNIDSDIIIKAWLALKDCDLLANALMMKEENNIYAIRNKSDNQAFFPKINDEMFNALQEGRPFNGTQHLITIYDSWTGRLCWLYNYHYDFSKQTHIKNKINVFFLSYLPELKKQSIEHGFTNFKYLDNQVKEITTILQKRKEL